jgi:hypothetical protein
LGKEKAHKNEQCDPEAPRPKFPGSKDGVEAYFGLCSFLEEQLFRKNKLSKRQFRANYYQIAFSQLFPRD